MNPGENFAKKSTSGSVPKSPRFLCIGSATQDVFLSRSDDFKPVDEAKIVREKVGDGHEKIREIFREEFEFGLGDKIVVNRIDFRTGGGANNATTTFARNGFETAFMGTIGRNDPAGVAVLRDFDREGVDTSLVSFSDKYSTDYSTLLLAPSGERTILTYRGCGIHLKENDFNATEAFAKFAPDWLYVTSLAGHFEIYDELFREAHNYGIKIAWNPGAAELSHPEKVRALLPDVEVLSLNKEEARHLVDGDTIEILARKLKSFVPAVLVTDGINGSIAIDKTSVVRAGLYAPDAKRIDATGAGDAFASGFVAKYATGHSLKDSVHFASANSASVVLKVGAKPGILSGREQLTPMQIDVRPANY